MAEVTVDMGGFEEAPQAYARAADRTLRTWGFEVERRAKIKSPIDTGFNANTIYTVTPDGRFASNGQQIPDRPPSDTARKSTKHPGRTYKPGQFADMATFAAPTYHEQLDVLAGGVHMMGGSGQGIGPSAASAPDEMAVEVRVGSEYGIYLEMGTKDMTARAFLGPSANEVTPMIDTLMKTNLGREGLL